MHSLLPPCFHSVLHCPTHSRQTSGCTVTNAACKPAAEPEQSSCTTDERSHAGQSAQGATEFLLRRVQLADDLSPRSGDCACGRHGVVWGVSTSLLRILLRQSHRHSAGMPRGSQGNAHLCLRHARHRAHPRPRPSRGHDGLRQGRAHHNAPRQRSRPRRQPPHHLPLCSPSCAPKRPRLLVELPRRPHSMLPRQLLHPGLLRGAC
mmetsp:Transcript_27015/g.54883  ORF Transcript_27015/g.54883 Transcript_27015/m.54883 type:complete len:206 (+) Transcript_27015:297-914(+)